MNIKNINNQTDGAKDTKRQKLPMEQKFDRMAYGGISYLGQALAGSALTYWIRHSGGRPVYDKMANWLGPNFIEKITSKRGHEAVKSADSWITVSTMVVVGTLALIPIKWLEDKIFSAILLFVFSPVFLCLALAIKLESRGPVLFKQKRFGYNNQEFEIYKFRSMYHGDNPTKVTKQATKDDPRVTKVGRFIRKTSIDELPQLFNVFVGEMSLVGPRPPLPSEVDQYKPWQRRRLSVKRVIAGPWQVSGRYEIDFEEWMRMDLEYIDNWSLALDIKLLAMTVPVVVLGTGAK